MVLDAAANGAVPPSTLAAQLVGNIATTARSSRPDENSELKRLFETIESVKNSPGLLKTPEDHRDHNHMLIYVYACVKLDSLKWDDPFANRNHLQSEASQTLQFLKLTIQEDPAVLFLTTDGSRFLHRGREPLWVWLFPRILNMLGHAHCLPLASPLESFFIYIIKTARTTGGLWNMCEPLYGYLQGNFRSILTHFKSSFPDTRSTLYLELPEFNLVSLLPELSAVHQSQGCSYTLVDNEQALRHASSLLRILCATSVTENDPGKPIVSSNQHLPWLLDSLGALNEEQKRWKDVCAYNPVSLLEEALGIAYPPSSVDFILSHKVDAMVVLISADVAEQTNEVQDEDANLQSTTKVLALALVHLANASIKKRPIAKLSTAQLLKTLDRLITEGRVQDNGDLKRSILLLKQAVATTVDRLFSPSLCAKSFRDADLRSKVLAMEAKYLPAESQERAAKRSKMSKGSSTLSHVMRRLCKILDTPETQSLGTMENKILDWFPDANDIKRCSFIELLTRLSCACDDTLILTRAGSGVIQCSFCSRQESSEPRPICRDTVTQSLVSIVFTKLVTLASFRESQRSRVVAMIALRRVILHSEDPELFDLEKSVLGQWCLQSLQSSVRELRIAAGRAIALFLRRDVGQAVGLRILSSNTANALSFLKGVSDRNEPSINETCLMAWGQVGRVVSDDGLNLVLVKMLELLGHQNPIISAVALNEITNLASHRKTTPRRLLEPFWRSLAYLTVKDMFTRPQTTQMVADLLKTNVTELLLLIQSHALPWLVLHRRKDIIQRFLDARKETLAPSQRDSEHVWTMLYIDDANLSTILSRLLVQDEPNLEEYVRTVLRDVCQNSQVPSLKELLSTNPVPTTLELLKMSGEADDSMRAIVRSALTTVAGLLTTPPKEVRKRGHYIIGRFLSANALGLSTHLIETINCNTPISPTVQERKRCIRAMEEMIVLAKEYIRTARPQISVCLLSVLPVDDLRSASFSCWMSMLIHLEAEDVEALLETTFIIIDQYWSSFEQEAREKCKSLLSYLLKHRGDVLDHTLNKLPSLSHISDLSELWKQLVGDRSPLDTRGAFIVFMERISHENSGVVERGLVELSEYLRLHQDYLQTSALSEQPDPVVTDLSRALLDCASKYNGVNAGVSRLCAECIGFIGCLDSNRLETLRVHRDFIVLHNFTQAEETTDFVAFLLEEVLVKSFVSTSDVALQGFLAYVMQELLERCDFKAAVAIQGASPEAERIYRKWLDISESAREVLAPFLTSRGQNLFADIIFEPLCRAIRVKDLSIAVFLLPYLVVHQDVPENCSNSEREDRKMFCEAGFRVIDHCLRWLQLKKSVAPRRSDEANTLLIQERLDAIPAELLSQRAIECKQFARALFHLEPHILRQKEMLGDETDSVQQALNSLQHVYTQIDEPDGLEGVSANLKVIDLNQQILSHRKAGRWSRAQTWCEVQLAEDPTNVDVQLDLLTCLKESGQYDVLLNHVSGMTVDGATINKIAPFAVEAAWATNRWETLQKYLDSHSAGNILEDFNLGIGSALLALRGGQTEDFVRQIKELKERTASTMSLSATASLQAAHESMLKCHVLADLDIIAGGHKKETGDEQHTMTLLNRRLEMLGAYTNDKQYVLGIRRAAMELMRPKFTDGDISTLWLASARLARKSDSLQQSFNAVLHASQLGDGSATIENARLLWKEGHHRKAIQILENAIQTDSFIGYNLGPATGTSSKGPEMQRNLLTARAHLLLAKWQDSAGQTHASALRSQYQQAAKTHATWEKGHYYLGRHYKKVLESEKTLPPDEQSDEYLTGELAKLVIENYIRSLNYGTKYLYQTLPRILTLWLDLGAQVDKAPEGKVSLSRELHHRRKTVLHELNKYIARHLQRMPAYIFYPAMPQMVARITHPNPEIFSYLQTIILKVVDTYPRQALWGLFAIITTKQPGERYKRGTSILGHLRNSKEKKVEGCGYDLKTLFRMGEKLAEQLLLACNNGDFQSNRTTHASITRDLNFNHKCTPCPLVVPIETSLTATLPTMTDNIKKHKAFSRDVISINSFLDDVLVLGSLAKPRRLTARGSDGRLYNLLIKPKDDLRTDQRLMEFNGMINRSLKRDAECSRRQLYIRTYAVVPLNEECGIIEWVDGLKTLRDILLGLYKTRGIAPNYGQIQNMMKEAVVSDKNITLFTEQILGMFPPVLPTWFISQFPNPSAWFAARLKYTRSCAVMSMVGTILGLGDRHGENVLLEEGNGGVFHVDFNCLFDKGLTFQQPERVPFRLTHNMVAAMGIYGYEGPFRQCSELTLSILRQQEETLMTILEAFIYDPTLDLQRDKKRKNDLVRLNPTSVVENIKRKVRGLLPNESIPLGVEGQVEELIKQATNPRNLSSMYIGWCPFL
ncbi:serine/threonine-protein kinase M1 [Gnomoniopsis smithogilvyi]|uniref:Serine/threonine-protein kinase MEC1 n=1 Tax=Gnomoniopsis smithogilvyi TaxID=1191159 RepID=A0A9W8YMI8_9PEZI|nr:serine/threonine-protein kinase M1 [Gnomoniopsis smithogilvyi]